MSEFRGFSDREIKTLQRQKQQQTQQEIRQGQAAFRPADFSRPRAKITRGEKSYDHGGTPPDSTALPTTAYFVKEAQKPPLAAKSDQTRPNETNTGEEEPEKDQRGNNKDHHPPSSVSTATQESITECKESNLPDLQMDNQATVETNLELLQRQQKELEQENKKKKALLEQTLRERYAQSQMETKKLLAVKGELAKLDSLLNRDVAILRAKIEEADRQYTATRKRYDAAETEFVAAKLALHKASEAKELLSEHLCAIIQQNELRKSEKLAELLKTLELESQSEEENATTKNLSGLFQKTPTPGINIWPRERLCSNETQSNKNDTRTISGDDVAVRDDGSGEERVGSQKPADPPDSCPTRDESTPKTTENSGHDNNMPLILF